MIAHRLQSRLLGLVVAALLLAPACGRGQQPGSDSGAADRPTTVRAYITKDPASLSLLGKTDRNAEIVAVQLTDSLVQYDPQLHLQPRVARNWEFSEDRLTLTFRLRPGVRWHDGQPVTAEDVVFTVNKVREPEVENRVWAPEFKDLESVEAADPSTVVARYRSASPDVLEAWRVPLLPRHIAGRDEDLLTGEFSRHPVGCGPFRFVRYDPGSEIVLDANDDYWDGRPYIDRLVLKIYADQRTAYQALLTGDLDLLAVSSALWKEAQKSPAADRLDAFVYSLFNVWPVFWNQDGSNPFFDDARVRRAMTLALDREPFIRNIVHGHARPGATTYHPDSEWTDPGIRPWPYDPAAAARLLDEAGWSDHDGDGVRDRDGRDFRFSLMIPSGSQQLTDQIAIWLQQEWRKVGVIAEIEKLEWQAFRERRNEGRFEAATFSLSFTPNPDQFALYHSSARSGGYNFYGLNDPEIDRLTELGRETLDPQRRREVFRQLQARLHELEPLSCLFHFSSPVLHDRRLTGVVPSPLDYWRTTQGPRVWRWNEDS